MNDEVRMTNNGEKQKSDQRSTFWQAMGFAWDFGIVVVIPLVALGVGGRLLDSKLGTSPWLFLIGVIVSIIISTVLIVIRLTSIMSKISSGHTIGSLPTGRAGGSAEKKLKKE